MSFARGRPLFCLLGLLFLTSLAWAHRADAQAATPAASRRVVVLVVLPSAARLDASRLRTEVGAELDADVVAPDDPLAPVAAGTLTLGLDASGDRVTLRYDARTEPVSRQMAIPPSPDAAERAIVLLAGNLARDESAELALAVRDRRTPKAEAPVVREPDAAPRSTVHFGVGGEGLFWYVPASSPSVNLGARVFGRMIVDLSPIVTFRADLGVGALGSIGGSDHLGDSTRNIPVAVRTDLQLNVARHYAIGFGIDLGVDVYSFTGRPLALSTSPNATAESTTAAEGLLGLHVSPVTLRFGRENQFQWAVQEGVILLLEEQKAVFEQTLGFAYFFGSGGGT